jgi:hypothetical protein
MDYQFEDDEVLAAVKSSDYARQQIGGHLALMSCEQKWSLYRAIVSLAEKPAAAHHSSVKRSPEALARLVPKLRDLKSTIDAMSDSEYGDWVDALPEDEFTEFIALGEEGIAAIFRESPQ